MVLGKLISVYDECTVSVESATDCYLSAYSS